MTPIINWLSNEIDTYYKWLLNKFDSESEYDPHTE